MANEILIGDEYVLRPRAGSMKSTLDLSEKKRVAKYLENPVASGLWQLTTDWAQTSGISGDLLLQLDQETTGRDTLNIRSGKRVRTIKITEQWKQKITEEVACTLTFVLALFDQLASQDEQRPENSDKYSAAHETVQLLLDIVDIGPIKEKYADALKLFKTTLWTADFRPQVSEGDPVRMSTGVFTLQRGPRQSGQISAIGWSEPPLRSLLCFLRSVGKVNECTLMPVFSPEEEVFAPYFDLLGMAYDYAVPQKHLQPLIEKSLSNFSEENYLDCVSALGLASEDVLTQVFETFYREQLTKGLTLGQLADEIQGRAAALFKRKEDPLPDLSALYPEIKAAIDDPNTTTTRSLELLRKLLTMVQEVNKATFAKIERAGRPEHRVLIWPDRVEHAVNELIRYRNAASHKSRIPIGPMECRRAAYAFIVLLRWWLNERTLIDWGRSPEEILRACVERNRRAA